MPDSYPSDNGKIVAEGITFDDILLVPGRSDVLPRDVDLNTRLTRNIDINIPLMSSPMDTVTESSLAIALAQEGGIGTIHRNMSIEAQAREVHKVKRSESGVIIDPVTLRPSDSVARAREIMSLHNISGVPITVDGNKLAGILTSRDLKFLETLDKTIKDVMTATNLVTGPPNTTLDQAEVLLNRAKVEKLLLVDDENRLTGLITMRDIERSREYPRSCKDERGRLRAAAAVGVHDYERVERLIASDVDVIVIDTAHGHTRNVMDTVKKMRADYDVEMIVGNIATRQAAADLIEAGADGLRIGIGPGSICTTRVVTGMGMPQITAIMEAVAAAEPNGVPVIADGGIRFSGDITKAIAAGAHVVMLGSLFAGLDESPGELVVWRGRRFKEYRGMGSLGAMASGTGAADRYEQCGKAEARRSDKFVPEGVEGRVPYRGTLGEVVYQLVGGLQAGMGGTGSKTIQELRKNARFIRISSAGMVESHPHDISIMKESPNYAFGTSDE